MFGNKTGWIISAIIVCLEALAMFGLYSASQPSDPGKIGQNAAKYVMELPVAPETYGKTFMTDNSQPGSGPLYLKAIQDYRDHKKDYKAFFERKDFLPTRPGQKMDPASVPAPPTELAAIQILKDAAKFANGRPFSADPSKLGDIINYQGSKESLETLKEIVDCTWHMGRWQNAKGNKKEAIACFQAIFALGHKLYQERLVLEELDKGLGFMNSAAADLAPLVDPTQKAALLDFAEQSKSFRKDRVDPVQRSIQIINANAGDLIAFAQKGGDRMWRVEGALGLGRVKFTATRMGDQKGAARAAKALMNDTDDTVRYAAKLAYDLTVEDFRVQGN